MVTIRIFDNLIGELTALADCEASHKNMESVIYEICVKLQGVYPLQDLEIKQGKTLGCKSSEKIFFKESF